MTLPRVDVRFKLDPDFHVAAKAVCEAEGLDLGEFVERIVVEEVRRRVHAASVITRLTARLGISGSGREQPGTSGSGRE